MSKSYLINSKAEYDAIDNDISKPSPSFEYYTAWVVVNSGTVYLVSEFDFHDSTAGTPNTGQGMAVHSDSGSGLAKVYSTSLTLGRYASPMFFAHAIGSTVYIHGPRYDYVSDEYIPTTAYSGYWTWDGSTGAWNETHSPVVSPTDTDPIYSLYPLSNHNGDSYGFNAINTVDSDGYYVNQPKDTYLSINGNDGNGWDDDRLIIDGSYYNPYFGGVDFASPTAWYFSWE
jgi:hypothetical protein